MSDRDKFLNNQILKGETVTLTGKKMIINLIVFDMFDFNMILSIDFISRYGAEIDYRKKKVWFCLDDSEEFTFSEGHN